MVILGLREEPVGEYARCRRLGKSARGSRFENNQGQTVEHMLAGQNRSSRSSRFDRKHEHSIAGSEKGPVSRSRQGRGLGDRSMPRPPNYETLCDNYLVVRRQAKVVEVRWFRENHHSSITIAGWTTEESSGYTRNRVRVGWMFGQVLGEELQGSCCPSPLFAVAMLDAAGRAVVSRILRGTFHDLADLYGEQASSPQEAPKSPQRRVKVVRSHRSMAIAFNRAEVGARAHSWRRIHSGLGDVYFADCRAWSVGGIGAPSSTAAPRRQRRISWTAHAMPQAAAARMLIARMQQPLAGEGCAREVSSAGGSRAFPAFTPCGARNLAAPCSICPDSARSRAQGRA